MKPHGNNRNGTGLFRLSLGLAAVLFTWIFVARQGGGGFWLRLHASTLLLAAIALRDGGFSWPERLAWRRVATLRNLVGGMVAAAALYLVFWVGREGVTRLLPDGGALVGSIYRLGDQAPRWRVALGLLFIVGPCEEIFWRGYVQKRLQARHGLQGVAITIGMYTLVHLAAGNLVLIGAAFVCGTFWGLLLWRFDSLTMNMLSHGVWAATIFAVFPLA